jgi:hypothetical protein
VKNFHGIDEFYFAVLRNAASGESVGTSPLVQDGYSPPNTKTKPVEVDLPWMFCAGFLRYANFETVGVNPLYHYPIIFPAEISALLGSTNLEPLGTFRMA